MHRNSHPGDMSFSQGSLAFSTLISVHYYFAFSVCFSLTHSSGTFLFEGFLSHSEVELSNHYATTRTTLCADLSVSSATIYGSKYPVLSRFCTHDPQHNS